RTEAEADRDHPADPHDQAAVVAQQGRAVARQGRELARGNRAAVRQADAAARGGAATRRQDRGTERQRARQARERMRYERARGYVGRRGKGLTRKYAKSTSSFLAAFGTAVQLGGWADVAQMPALRTDGQNLASGLKNLANAIDDSF